MRAPFIRNILKILDNSQQFSQIIYKIINKLINLIIYYIYAIEALEKNYFSTVRINSLHIPERHTERLNDERNYARISYMDILT